ncbi:MAG: RES family NAD+ phosphorylase [Jatrophihabitantaceae bacterium]
MLRRRWFRLDVDRPSEWSWRAYPTPRSRFDPASGGFRVRYAGDAQRVAMRERFDNSERVVRAPDLELHLVELSGAIRVLDLRRDRTLDALGLDDQINTSRAPGVWLAGQALCDRVHEWFGERCEGIVYRSRTTPQRSANIAFFAHTPLQAHDLGRLRGRDGLLAACVLSDGFAVQDWR